MADIYFVGHIAVVFNETSIEFHTELQNRYDISDDFAYRCNENSAYTID